VYGGLYPGAGALGGIPLLLDVPELVLPPPLFLLDDVRAGITLD
jgi:hypothetical protein